MTPSPASLPRSPLPFGIDANDSELQHRSASAPQLGEHNDSPSIATADAASARTQYRSNSIALPAVTEASSHFQWKYRKHRVLLLALAIIFELGVLTVTVVVVLGAVHAHQHDGRDGVLKTAIIIVGVFGATGIIGSSVVAWLVWQGHKDHAQCENGTADGGEKGRESVPPIDKASPISQIIRNGGCFLDLSRNSSQGRIEKRNPSFKELTPTPTPSASSHYEKDAKSPTMTHYLNLDDSSSEEDIDALEKAIEIRPYKSPTKKAFGQLGVQIPSSISPSVLADTNAPSPKSRASSDTIPAFDPSDIMTRPGSSTVRASAAAYSPRIKTNGFRSSNPILSCPRGSRPFSPKTTASSSKSPISKFFPTEFSPVSPHKALPVIMAPSSVNSSPVLISSRPSSPPPNKPLPPLPHEDGASRVSRSPVTTTTSHSPPSQKPKDTNPTRTSPTKPDPEIHPCFRTYSQPTTTPTNLPRLNSSLKTRGSITPNAPPPSPLTPTLRHSASAPHPIFSAFMASKPSQAADDGGISRTVGVEAMSSGNDSNMGIGHSDEGSGRTGLGLMGYAHGGEVVRGLSSSSSTSALEGDVMERKRIGERVRGLVEARAGRPDLKTLGDGNTKF